MTSTPPLPAVAITGFRPFLTVEDNPSAHLVASCEGDAAWAGEAGVAPRFRLLDTVYAGLRDQLAELLEPEPAALVMCGYSSLARGLKIETRATSLCSPKFADASGWQPPPSHDPVTESGNGAVDFPALVDALRAAEVPAALSDDAGEYVCNHAYFHALDLVETRGLATRTLFLHLPGLAGLADPEGGAGRMDLATMRRGLAVVARSLADGTAGAAET